ncbi:hypothetical protein [Alteromonas gracilis]|uniref:hypothetical protein n=1 Tax=Alteromonas gracilis TaxID=1479524 RepID=UPI0037354489
MKISTCRAQFDMGMPFKLVHYYGPVVTSSFDPLEELARIESELFGFYYPYPLLFKHEQ